MRKMLNLSVFNQQQMRDNKMPTIETEEQYVQKYISLALSKEDTAQKIARVVRFWSKYPHLNNDPFALYEQMRDNNKGKFVTLLTSLYGIIKADVALNPSHYNNE